MIFPKVGGLFHRQGPFSKRSGEWIANAWTFRHLILIPFAGRFGKASLVREHVADSHFDFLGYRFKRSRRGRLIRLVRPKSLRKLRESIKPKTRRNNGKSMEAIVADINRTLKGRFGYFKHVHPSELEEIDRWMRVRLRSILRRRRGGRGRGRGQDHHRWPNRYFTGPGLFCLLDAKVSETTSLRQGANH